ncbi:MlaD family protein [Rhodococcus sp. (in: high G+C Gram-positive bacteria)]|uniref:MlaD family protein n=1 Tax=Rhodococcus sp. TaxID=1831 RepID=UPI003BAE5750
MSVPTRVLVPLLKLLVAGIAAVMLFVLILNAIKNPVEGTTSSFSADFTDVSGLHENADVRIRGVKVGKVTGLELGQDKGESFATVAFTLSEPNTLTTSSSLAVKYANLSGVRYVDITGPADGTPVTHASTAMTVPSFDVTQLFNGLQPVLETLSPAELNEFSENALTILQGDGQGMGPMLESIEKLSRYTVDRQQVISALVTNLARISETMGGKSPQILEFIRYLQAPIDSAFGVLDQFQKAAAFGPSFMGAVDNLLIGLGINEDLDIDRMLAAAIPDVDQMVETLRILPSFLRGLQTQVVGKGDDQGCAFGQASLPELPRVLFGGAEVLVCNAS